MSSFDAFSWFATGGRVLSVISSFDAISWLATGDEVLSVTDSEAEDSGEGTLFTICEGREHLFASVCKDES